MDLDRKVGHGVAKPTLYGVKWIIFSSGHPLKIMGTGDEDPCFQKPLKHRTAGCPSPLPNSPMASPNRIRPGSKGSIAGGP